MARKNTPKSYESSTERGLKSNETYNAGNGRILVPAPPAYTGKKYIKDKSAPEGRYVYRYQAEQFRQTGRVADPKKEIVHHTTEKYDDGHFSPTEDRHVAIESRSAHYGKGHGRPFSRPKGARPRKF